MGYFTKHIATLAQDIVEYDNLGEFQLNGATLNVVTLNK